MIIQTLSHVRKHINAKALRFERVVGSERDAVLDKIEARQPNYPDGIAEMVRVWLPCKGRPNGKLNVYVRCICCKGNGHGDTWRRVGNVYRGEACNQCENERRTKTADQYDDEIADRAITRLGDYVNTMTKTLHRCDGCGDEWKIRPNDILNGQGCPQCGLRRRAAKRAKPACQYDNEIADRAITRTGEYVSTMTKIMHRCDGCHHEWKVAPSHVLSGRGCPRCADYGFQIDRPAVLYVVRVRHKKTNTVSIKFGITSTTVEKRYSTRKRSRYILDAVLWVSAEHPGDVVYAAEQQIISDLKAQGIQFQEGTKEMMAQHFCEVAFRNAIRSTSIGRDFYSLSLSTLERVEGCEHSFRVVHAWGEQMNTTEQKNSHPAIAERLLFW